MFEIPNFWTCSSDTGVGRRCKRLNRSEPFLHERYQGFWWGHGHRRTVSEKGSCTFGVYRKKMLRRTCWKTLLLPRFKKPNAQIPNQLGWPSSIVQLVGLSNWRVQIYNMGCDIGFGIGFCNAGWADDVSSPNINSKMDSEEDSTWKRVGLLHSFQRDVAPCERECTNRRHTFSSKIKLLK